MNDQHNLPAGTAQFLRAERLHIDIITFPSVSVSMSAYLGVSMSQEHRHIHRKVNNPFFYHYVFGIQNIGFSEL